MVDFMGNVGKYTIHMDPMGLDTAEFSYTYVFLMDSWRSTTAEQPSENFGDKIKVGIESTTPKTPLGRF